MASQTNGRLAVITVCLYGLSALSYIGWFLATGAGLAGVVESLLPFGIVWLAVRRNTLLTFVSMVILGALNVVAIIFVGLTMPIFIRGGLLTVLTVFLSIAAAACQVWWTIRLRAPTRGN